MNKKLAIEHLNERFLINFDNFKDIKLKKKGTKASNLKLLAFCSGGKDSMFSLYLALKKGHNVTSIVNFISKNGLDHFGIYPKTIMQEMGRQLGIRTIQPIVNKKNFIKKFESLLSGEIKNGVNGIVCGHYWDYGHRDFLAYYCNKYDLALYEPLCNKDGSIVLKKIIQNKFKLYINEINSSLIDKKWLGKYVTDDFLAYLKKIKKINPEFHIGGESSEYSTLITYMPLFKNELKYISKKNSIIRYNDNLFLGINSFKILK